MLTVIGCITQQHDPRLVVLAALICVIACFTATNMLARCDGSAARVRLAWLVGAGVAFGGGVWSTHFIAMLAFEPGLPVQYRLAPTLLSALLAMTGAAVAFALRRHLPKGVRDGAGALALCGTVGGMHYLGASAMQVPADIRYEPGFVLASLVAGLLPMAVAIRVRERGHGLGARLHAALWLTVGICALHFIGMAGTTLLPLAGAVPEVGTIASGPLAIVVAAVSVLLLLLSLSGALVDERFAVRAASEATRLRQLVNATSEGIIITVSGVTLDLNDAACAILGRPAAEVVNRKILHFLPADEQEMLRHHFRAPVTAPVSLHAVLPDGTLRPVEVTSRAIEHDGKPAMVFGVRDLTEVRRDQARIDYLAHHDGLTDLPNRRLFNDRLAQALEQAARQGGRLAVLCLDLDRFKPVNDLLGHHAGDQLLAQVAERLRAGTRVMDTVARMGGDEFAILQPVAEAAAAATLARRLVERIAEPFALDAHTVEIGVSIGVAVFPEDGTGAARLLMNADTALYRAKQEGRDTFRFFEKAMDSRAQERRALEHDLRHAIARGELAVHFQPFFAAAGGAAIGCEALLRWTHPDRGAIPPAEFIPIAEASGLIVALGRWVLHTACAEAASWPAHLTVAVNLSPVQFRQPDIPAMVADTLRATGLAAHRLELEVTEGVLIDAPDRARALLAELKLQGVRIALDDFGTGYSSLSYLRRLPFDKLKIDRSFVDDLGRSADADAVLHAIVTLAHSLRLTVIAEGVETPAQLRALRAHDCDLVQGYLLGRPMPAVELPWTQDAEQVLMLAV